jgi:acetyl esterase/lipase
MMTQDRFRLTQRVIRKIILSLSLLVTAGWGVSGAQALVQESWPAGKLTNYTTTNFTTWNAPYSPTNTSSQAVEVYYPKNWSTNNPVPGVLLFHGGGWSSGSRTQMRYICNQLASNGVVAATADYVMLNNNQVASLPKGVSRKRVCITSASSAWHWFQQNAAQLGVDPKRIVIGGDSAGGHIAVMCTLNRELDWPGDPQGMTNPVLAYLMFNPAFDVEPDREVVALDYTTNNMAPYLFMEGETDPWIGGVKALYTNILALSGNRVSEYVAAGVGHNYWVGGAYGWANCNLAQCENRMITLGLMQGPAKNTAVSPYVFSTVLSRP